MQTKRKGLFYDKEALFFFKKKKKKTSLVTVTAP
jgi:hypothetical protein